MLQKLASVATAAPLDRGHMRLRTLYVLRWMAVAGQAAAILFVHYALGYMLPLGWCLGVIAVSAWLNIFTGLRFPAGRILSEREAVSYLGFDIIQLTALLMLTGGIQNPFTLLFIAPVSISASVLSLRATLALSGLAVAAISTLAVVYLPLPWGEAAPLQLPAIYIGGIWTSLVLGVGFTAAYAWRIAEERARMSNALAATQLILAREQKLAALGGLAAAAAHELGTPLATIQVVAKEMASELGPDTQLSEDADLLLSQTARCREILGRLSSRGEEGDIVHDRLTLKGLFDEAAGPYQGDPSILYEIEPDAAGAEPVLRRQPEILYGLGNLIENAADFARSEVRVRAGWSADSVALTVEDDGPGFPVEIIPRLGEPYVTTRPAAARSAKTQGETHSGMGLGFFIAKTLLERTGATVSVANATNAAGRVRGARVEIRWPRALIEAGV